VLCSPNFGYQHVLKTCHPEQFSQLDLAPVRILFNGAEPISVELCEEFLAALAPSGLQPTAMFPVYGLAEASLAVTFPPPGIHYRTATVSRHALNVGATVETTDTINTDAVTFVGVGHPVAGCAVRIADENGQPLPAQTVGRILIRGDNVTHGYYRNAAATREAISAEGWLDTGDLGFLGNDGLVVTGRLKDILFINGQNYYPQDIENVLVKHAGIELGKIAVCGVRPPDREADVVLVFVLHRSAPDNFVPIAKNIRKCVNEKVGIAVGQVIPVDRIPKTTSGKIQRYLLAQQYQVGAFAPIIAQLQAFGVQDSSAGSEQQNEIERTLREICNTFITDKTVGLHDNIFELGTNSLTLAQIHQRIEAAYPNKLQITDFFDYPTIADLAKYLGQQTAVQA
jgi:acyl-CoA synthetase (AMP-forming)/AMP-acid ligase II/acyl carrier protein